MLNHTFGNTPIYRMKKVMEINLGSKAFLEESMKNVDAIHMHLALFFPLEKGKYQRNIFKDRYLQVYVCILIVFCKDTTSFASSSGK